jgi:hypothetical protein
MTLPNHPSLSNVNRLSVLDAGPDVCSVLIFQTPALPWAMQGLLYLIVWVFSVSAS